MPAFETGDGKHLMESNAIAYYVSNKQLRGGDDFQQSQVQQWISFAENEIIPASCSWVFPLLGIMPLNKNTIERSKDDIKFALEVLNKKLLNCTYLVGERITLADIVVFCNLLHLYKYVLEPSVRAPYGCVTRWFTTILNQPEVKTLIPSFEICAKTLEFDPKKFSEFQAKTGGKEKKEDKKPKQEVKKEPKEKEPEEELDAADAALAMEPKSKDPFDTMPKGTFNFDDFKRCYSNEDETKSIPYFWEKFDSEN